MSETTTITVKKTTKVRLESVGRYGESMDDIVNMLLFSFRFPKSGAGGLYGSRIVMPVFSKEEIDALYKRLNPTPRRTTVKFVEK